MPAAAAPPAATQQAAHLALQRQPQVYCGHAPVQAAGGVGQRIHCAASPRHTGGRRGPKGLRVQAAQRGKAPGCRRQVLPEESHSELKLQPAAAAWRPRAGRQAGRHASARGGRVVAAQWRSGATGGRLRAVGCFRQSHQAGGCCGGCRAPQFLRCQFLRC